MLSHELKTLRTGDVLRDSRGNRVRVVRTSFVCVFATGESGMKVSVSDRNACHWQRVAR